jgi:hypothetical protein
MFPRVAVMVCAARLAWLLALAGCGASEGDAPVEALARFIEAMDRSGQNESARKEAFTMLDETSQAALAERAHRSALVTGRPYEPWEMIAPGRFRLRFALAEHSGMRATVSGDKAVVHVRGHVGVRGEEGRQTATVPMLRQAGTWRVQLPLPASPGASSPRMPRVP